MSPSTTPNPTRRRSEQLRDPDQRRHRRRPHRAPPCHRDRQAGLHANRIAARLIRRAADGAWEVAENLWAGQNTPAAYFTAVRAVAELDRLANRPEDRV